MAVFGAFGVAHGMNHSGICFIAMADGTPCPEADIAGFINRHFDILRIFSTAVFALSIVAAFFVVLAYVIGAPSPRRDVFLSRAPRSLFTVHYSLFIEALRWLARFEHSPSFTFARG
ncbi:MAG: hypothetical protein HYW56_01035 [Candidatus Harrisonbacteria bacterium]|nr:hypothetical protein [Candidatus Harrisonbacteria bacterium]